MGWTCMVARAATCPPRSQMLGDPWGRCWSPPRCHCTGRSRCASCSGTWAGRPDVLLPGAPRYMPWPRPLGHSCCAHPQPWFQPLCSRQGAPCLRGKWGRVGLLSLGQRLGLHRGSGMRWGCVWSPAPCAHHKHAHQPCPMNTALFPQYRAQPRLPSAAAGEAAAGTSGRAGGCAPR